MDPDTSQKVSDLLSLMQNMESDIDFKAELGKVFDEIRRLQQQVAELTARFNRFEQTYLEKRAVVEGLRQELESLLD
ncbi:MAG: hypothetical protein BWY87_01047 [Deltaproteobacteria bacterium ADurb.Bin510]|nr:MAG: hypothetical protein BWY87_01047 [Deltaproteobacteria bacterium ADurb.Bin510]